jgi:hypothetical protein
VQHVADVKDDHGFADANAQTGCAKFVSRKLLCGFVFALSEWCDVWPNRIAWQWFCATPFIAIRPLENSRY